MILKCELDVQSIDRCLVHELDARWIQPNRWQAGIVTGPSAVYDVSNILFTWHWISYIFRTFEALSYFTRRRVLLLDTNRRESR